MIVDSIQFGSRTIMFSLVYTDRKTLGITVKPDMKVLVRAPIGSSVATIKEKLQQKAPWILKQQSYFLSFHPKRPPKRFVAGESHLYLGRQYRLKITSGESESVKLKGAFIWITSPDKSRIKQLLTDWYAKRAAIKFRDIAQPLIETFKKYQVAPSSIVLRDMPTRWGSCTPKGKIILNPELIKAPRACIEYVIIHELCHLIHHDHTQRFIDLQSREMPDWERWKAKLEQLLA